MSHEPPAKCDDPSTWNHKDEQIDLPRLLALIEAHGSPHGLDLHGCNMIGVDLSYQALLTYIPKWTGSQPPPWVYGVWGINLEGAHLERANLSAANLAGANLSLAYLQRTGFISSRLDKASFVRARANSVLIFQASARGAGLQNGDFTEANFTASDFREALFGGANLQRARLLNANLEGVDLRLTDLRGAMLHGARLEKTRIRPANVGRQVGVELVASGRQEMHYKVDYFEAADVYLDLKSNFSALGYHDAASWAYIKERQMEKMAYLQVWTRRRRGVFRSPIYWLQLLHPAKHSLRRWLLLWLIKPITRISFWRWFRNWTYELLTGYGERPQNPVLAGTFAIMAFALGYFFTAIDNFWDALVYSLATFATFNLADLEPHGRGMESASSVEALLGIAVLALFVFTLGNRMRGR
jgi:uncharacterized protein YjbI with pentapeptide repeats